MLSSHIVINVQECNNKTSDIHHNTTDNTDKCSNIITSRDISQDKLTTLSAPSSSLTLNNKHIAFQYSTASNYTLDIIQLMGLEMPPVRRRGYSGSGANYSVRNGPQSAGSLPNLHQHISVRSSSSNTSSPSTSHHHRTAAELSLLGDDSSDSGVSSRSPTPNNNFLASAGAAGDQGPPDERFIIKKTLKEIKQINSTSSNNTSKSSNNNSTTRVTSSHQRQPYYPYQHNHHSFQHNHQLQQQQRNHQHHNNTHRYHHSNNNNNNSNNSKSNSNNSGNNSNSSSNTSVNNSNSNSSNPKRRFSHSNHHCPQIPTSGRGRRSGLVVHVPSPPPPSSPTPSQPPMSSLIQPPQTSLLNNHLNSPLLYSGTPPDRFLSKSHLVQVTKTPPQLANGSRWDELSKAVWNKFLTNQQTEETYRKKLALWKCLYVYIKMMFPRYGLFLVGSTLSGFGSNTSDVDMCLLVRRQEMDQRSEALLHLSNVLHHLHHLDIIEKLELVQAKVPILKFRERNQGIDVDLNCNNAVGIRNTHLLSCYAKLDWRVRPLVLVVKLWAQWHDINDAKNMTISSYSLALMVIHFLQCGVSPPVLPCLHLLYQSKFSPYSDISTIDIHEEIQFQSENIQPLGELLLQFFSYYDSFDYSLYAVSVRLACRIPIEECRRVRTLKNEPHQWKYLCIEEPFDQTNTARSVYDLEAFERIRSIIHVTHCSLNTTHSLDSIFRLETSRSCHHSHHHHLHGHQHHHNSQHQQQSLGTGWSNQHQPYSVQMTQIPPSVPCQSHSHTSQSSTSSQTQSHLL